MRLRSIVDKLTSSKFEKLVAVDRKRQACSMMTTPPTNRAHAVSEIVCGEFYFADLIFVVRESTSKTAKIGSLENFRLYGIMCAGD